MVDRMLSRLEVEERTGLSRTTLWRRLRNGEFPLPLKLGSSKIGWLESEIKAWLATRPRRMYGD